MRPHPPNSRKYPHEKINAFAFTAVRSARFRVRRIFSNDEKVVGCGLVFICGFARTRYRQGRHYYRRFGGRSNMGHDQVHRKTRGETRSQNDLSKGSAKSEPVRAKTLARRCEKDRTEAAKTCPALAAIST